MPQISNISPVVIFLNLNFSNFKFGKLRAPGIENNPRPSSSFKKFAYHQGSIGYKKTAGSQWNSNSFFAICCTALKIARIWESNDIDFILGWGDLLKTIKTIREKHYLEVDELPLFVDIQGQVVELEKLQYFSDIFNTNSNSVDLLSHHKKLTFN